MKYTKSSLLLFFSFVILFIANKSNGQNTIDTKTKFETLVQYLETNNNFINSESAPTIILADEINENVKNKKYLVIDIRSDSWFKYGHIKNAVNVPATDLLTYFETKISPSNFDKITLVCYSGQSAAYYTSLLRLYGYNNVFNLKWGMSSWADEFATDYWVKNSANNNAEKLEKVVNNTPEKGDSPTIISDKIDGKDILKERIQQAFKKPYKDFITKSADVFINPDNFFVMNYENEDKYNVGHIKGAVRYQPKSSLLSTKDLLSIPTNKKVVVCCSSGQSAAYVVAYLNILGYDVSNLAYGENSYMNAILVEKNWGGFSKNEIKNYNVVE